MIIIDSIRSENFTLIPKNPIFVEYIKEDDCYSAECNLSQIMDCNFFELFAIGDSELDIKNSIEEDIVYLWTSLAKEDDSKIESNALKYARLLRESFVEIPN